MLKDEDIEQVKDVLVNNFQPLLIYLFGSYSKRSNSEQSDLDLVVIDQDQHFQRHRDIAMNIALQPRNYHLDLLYYSESDFKRKVQEGWSFFQEVQKNGKIIYSAQ